MRRIVRKPDDAADALIRQFVGDEAGTRKRQRTRGLSREKVRKRAATCAGKLGEMLAGKGDAADLVALYHLLHERVYGVEPAELTGDAWLGACSAAARLVRADFGGDFGKAVEFVRWVWAREKEWESYRRESGNGGRRITWRQQFGATLVTDFRLDVSRRRGTG